MTDPLGVGDGLVLSVLALDELAWSTVGAGRPGVPVSLWRLAVLALGAPEAAPTEDRLAAFAGTCPLVEVAHAPGDPFEVYRLSDPSAADSLWPAATGARSGPGDRARAEERITSAWLAYGRETGWDSVPLPRSLPVHASAAGMVDALLAEDGVLLRADPEVLRAVSAGARTRAGRLRASLLAAVTEPLPRQPSARAAAFGVTSTVEGLGLDIGTGGPAPYRAVWARTGTRQEHSDLTGHADDVTAVCSLLVDGQPVLATASRDATVRLWDLGTERLDRVLTGHTGSVDALCVVRLDGRELVASGGEDRTIRLWDPATGSLLMSIVDSGRVGALCRVRLDGRELVASGGEDGTIRLWDLSTAGCVRVMAVHSGLSSLTLDRSGRLVSAGTDGTLRVWDPQTGSPGPQLRHGGLGTTAVCALESPPLLAFAGAHGSIGLWDTASGAVRTLREAGEDVPYVTALCGLRLGGRSLVASAEVGGGYHQDLRLWEPGGGNPVRVFGQGRVDPVGALGTIEDSGRTLLAAGYAGSDPANFAPGDGTVQLWDPASGQPARQRFSHTGRVVSVHAVPAGEGALLASAGEDHTVRLWDPDTGRLSRILTGHVHWVNAVCPVPVGDGTLLASASHDRTVRLWDPQTGQAARVLDGHTNAVTTVCPVWTDDRWLLASAGYDATIRLWDPGTGRPLRVLEPRAGSVYALCPVPVDGRPLLATAGDDGVVRLWNPSSGELVRKLTGHSSRIATLCPVPVAGRTLLASAGNDRTVRLWDPSTGSAEGILTGHDGEVRSLCVARAGSETLLVSAGADATVRVWEPGRAQWRLAIAVPRPANAVAPAGPDPGSGLLAIGLDNGILAVRLR